ncbi:hypothetical protein [Streptomyces sp. RerS4]|uniref:hypothetical protein n=1 Tax=Streptomyces sp. RerS4 TaxID=2942449 RepID=UPI00201BF895|nr:hypothetical protein [Streptomyces sp. RerS4]UQX04708.1 hypothetical protein M4D82_32525 [Streptomyces sp. RerS4]
MLAEEPQDAQGGDQVRLSPPVAVQAQHVDAEGLQVGVAYVGKVVEPLLVQPERQDPHVNDPGGEAADAGLLGGALPPARFYGDGVVQGGQDERAKVLTQCAGKAGPGDGGDLKVRVAVGWLDVP